MKKEYQDFNKSTWFLFPIIADEILLNKPKRPKDPSPRDIYLIDTHLINTYIYPNGCKRVLYVKYKNDVEVVDIESYLTCDYLVDIKYEAASTTFIYEIKTFLDNPQSIKDILNYDYIVEGLYSKIDPDYKWKIYQMFNLGLNDYITRIFKKDEILWHERNKQLSCIDCKCKIETYSNNKGQLELKSNQKYLNCNKYKKFDMPHRLDIELEDKLDLEKEFYNYGI